jgi:hypothetical protein
MKRSKLENGTAMAALARQEHLSSKGRAHLEQDITNNIHQQLS